MNHHRHRQIGWGDVLARPVADRTGGVEARPARQDVPSDAVRTLDPQVGVLLPGERGVRGVLGGGAGADRDGHTVAEARVRGLYRGTHRRGEFRVCEEFRDRCCGGFISGRGAGRFQGGSDGFGDRSDAFAVSLDGHDESVGDAEPLCDKASQPEPLAADPVGHVGGAAIESQHIAVDDRVLCWCGHRVFSTPCSIMVMPVCPSLRLLVVYSS